MVKSTELADLFIVIRSDCGHGYDHEFVRWSDKEESVVKTHSKIISQKDMHTDKRRVHRPNYLSNQEFVCRHMIYIHVADIHNL